ncbi:MAG: hypothetical protein GX984_00795 [Erysipelothrix sp.]|nr:hypothetical protein [Erysipelothrix sp.]
MINERITRVINNHQLSCQNTNRNLYILVGFDPFIDSVDLPIKPLASDISDNENAYVLEKDFKQVKEDDFVLVYVIFNFFEGGTLDESWKLQKLDLNDFEKIFIFNQTNPLSGVVDNDLDDDSRIQYIKEVMK